MAVLGGLLSAEPVFAAASPLVNGGFETGDTTGWSVTPASNSGSIPAPGVSVVSTYTGTAGGSTYTPVEGTHFAVLYPGSAGSYTLLSQPFTASAGDVISGDSFFRANDYMPYNDNGDIEILNSAGSVVATPFQGSVSCQGNYGGTPWTHWSFTAPAYDSYKIQARVANVLDGSLSSVLGLDNVASNTAPASAPYIAWNTPAPITYGTPLSGTQLNATVSSGGGFTYTPPAGSVLPAGTYTLSAKWAGCGATPVPNPATTQLVVNQATPVITWATPAAISYPTALGAAQLNATANVPGSFTYKVVTSGQPASGQVLPASSTPQLVEADFTPTDTANYASTSATVGVLVNKGAQTISFASIPAHTYGDAPFSVSATGGMSGQPVTFTINPGDTCALSGAAAGTDPSGSGTGSTTVSLTGAGACTVTASQAGNSNYAAAQNVPRSFSTAKATPVISWTSPSPIVYGTPLGAAQLNASASTPGSFAYSPGASTTLPAGNYTLSATFTPADSANFTGAAGAVALTVSKAPQTISFAALPDRTFGDAPFTISATGGASTMPVSFTASGPCILSPSNLGTLTTLTGAGVCAITASQTGDGNYNDATAVTRNFLVKKATPQLSWPQPTPITYGTAVDSTKLNATSNVPGSFVYTADAGTASLVGQVLGAGNHTLTASFTPTDSANYTPSSATVVLTVNKALPKLSWTPSVPSFTYGLPLSADQLNATADVPGTFVYTPGLGALLNAGTPTVTALFTPTDSANYSSASGTTVLNVAQAAQSISFSSIANHTYGDAPFPVSATGGMSANPVTFVAADKCTLSEPSAGTTSAGNGTGSAKATITGAGACTITASQAGSANYLAAAAVPQSFTIAKATPQLAWPAPAPITYGTALGAAQLDASAPVPGVFSYTADAGTADATGQTLHAGIHTLRAGFNPTDSTNYTPAAAQVTLTVNQAPQTISFAALAGRTFGDASFMVAATGGGSANAVTFAATSGSNCTVTPAGQVTITGAGSCGVIASQPGNADYLAAAPVTRSFAIDRKQSSVGLAVIGNHSIGDAPFAVQATGSGSTSPITLVASPSNVCVIQGVTVTLTGPGACTITANQDGDANYYPSPPVTATFTVAYVISVQTDLSSGVHQNATLPLKLALLSSTGTNLSSGTIVVHAVGVDGTPVAPAPGSSQPGQDFRYTAASYQFNIKTTTLSVGSHTLTYTAGADPTMHTVTFTVIS